MITLTFSVRGVPVPQGSARAFVRGTRAVMVTRSAALVDWRRAIADAAADAMDGRALIDGPISVSAAFVMAARPASHFLPANSRRPCRTVRLDAPVWHTSPPDLDKACRALLDAMTGVVWSDDRQVAVLTARKSWPQELQAPGVTVVVSQLEGTR